MVENKKAAAMHRVTRAARAASRGGAPRGAGKASRRSKSSIFEADPTLAERPQSSVMSPLASVRMGRTEPSVFAEFSELSEKHHSVNLGQGFPDFPMPDFVKQAAMEAIKEDYNQYSRPAGHARLVDVLGRRYSKKFGREIDAMTEIGVVGGATNARPPAPRLFVYARRVFLPFRVPRRRFSRRSSPSWTPTTRSSAWSPTSTRRRSPRT